MSKLLFALAASSALAFPTGSRAGPPAATENVTVSGKLRQAAGGGLMTPQSGTTARSSISAEALRMKRQTANVATLLATAPGVTTSTKDPTGLFVGGTISMRGFDRNLLGFTLDGVPMNDPGTYDFVLTGITDTENLCQIDITQAGADPTSAQRGEIGGSIAFKSCAPTTAAHLSLQQTAGSYGFERSFVRLNTGAMPGGRLTAYVSYSHSTANVFDQPAGGADKTHVDLRASLKVGDDSSIDLIGFRDRSLANSINSVSMAQANAFGYGNGYTSDLPAFLALNPTPGHGTAQIAHYATSPNAVPINAHNTPFYGVPTDIADRTMIALAGDFALDDQTRLLVQPYTYHQYAGSTSQVLLGERSTFHAPVDVNGDGDTIDQVVASSFSESLMDRSGVLTRLTRHLGPLSLAAGYWFEDVSQSQYNPFQSIGSNGRVAYPFFDNNLALLHDAGGRVLQNRDWKTGLITHQVAVSIGGEALDGHLLMTAGVRGQFNQRRFENIANDNPLAWRTYTVDRYYAVALPSAGARYLLSGNSQVFANISTGQRIAPNFVDQQLVKSNGSIGAPAAIAPETSVTVDGGTRFDNRILDLQATLFDTKFYNRIGIFADPYNPLAPAIYRNLGGTENRGIEVELGTKPFQGWSVYLSGTYTDATLNGDIPVSANGRTVLLATKGRQFYNTPRLLGVASLAYDRGRFFGALQAKYTDRAYTTLTDDQFAPAYTTVDLTVGYRFPALDLGQRNRSLQPTLRVNVTNLFDTSYLTPTGGVNPNSYVLASHGAGASVATYNLGPPLAATASVSVDF